MRYKKLLLMMTVLVFYQANCSAHVTQEGVGSSTRIFGTRTANVLPTTSNTTLVAPTAFEQENVTITPMAATNEIVITPTATVQLTTQLHGEVAISNCLDIKPETVLFTPMITGLLLRDTGVNKTGVSIIGSDGLDEPAFFFADGDQNLILPIVSPDRNMFVDDFIVSVGGNRILKEAIIVRPSNNQNTNKPFDGIDGLPFDAKLNWINDIQLAIRLQNEEELYKWLIWSHTDDIQEVITVSLKGIGEAIQKYNVLPTIDPLVEYVVYPCENCDAFEYQTINIETGMVEWGVDLGENTSINYWGIPMWSPNGEYLAITNSNFGEAELWILNRQGENVYTVDLPEVDGVVGGGFISWSPNSQYLAFSRNNLASEIQKPTLAYLDIESGLVTDLCIDTKANMPLWSPDNSKLVFTYQSESGDPHHIITVVDIISREAIQLSDEKGHLIVGWMNLDQLDS